MAAVVPGVEPLGHHIVDYFFVAGCTTAEVAEAAAFCHAATRTLIDLEAHVVDRSLPSTGLSHGGAQPVPEAARSLAFRRFQCHMGGPGADQRP